MENFKNNDIPVMEDEELQLIVEKLQNQYKKNQLNFANTCYYVYSIVEYYKNKKYYLKDKKGYWYSATTLLEKFGFDKTSVSRYKSCFERFVSMSSLVEEDKCQLIEQYQSYSPSKLFELLVLDEEAIKKCFEMRIIKPDMTVKEIRKVVKSLINGDEALKVASPEIEKEEINEDEIPMVYDPVKDYDFEYFRSKSKNQLLNMIWALQQAYQKLKNKKK